jgi:hypothetical protein
MTNDFNIFAASDEDGPDIDPDIALIAAWLSRELGLVQMAAVQERLANDAAFREKVVPIIEAWTVPGTWDAGAAAAARSRALDTTSLTAAEIEAGWRRTRGRHWRDPISPPAVPAPPAINHTRRGTIMRIAATFTLIVAPVAVAAQLVVYAAKHEGTFGHDIARRIVAAWPRGPENTSRPLEELLTLEGRSGDGPVQITMAPSGQPDQQGIQVVDLSAPTAKTTEKFGAILGIKETPDGRLLVNDAAKRQIKLFDKSLATSNVVIDSAPGSARSYPAGNWPRPLIPFLGDSLLFSDVIASPQMVVLDPFGQVAHSLALLPGIGWGHVQGKGTGVDAKGRIVFMGPRVPRVIPGAAGNTTTRLPCTAGLFVPDVGPCSPNAPLPAGLGGGRGDTGNSPAPGLNVHIPHFGDSVTIIRGDFDRHRIDTIGFLRQPLEIFAGINMPYGGGRLKLILDKEGRPARAVQAINPLYYVDDFAVLSDGTIAIVRGSDYHVDWIHPDGTTTASPGLPFEWKRLTDSDKQGIIDSTKAHLDSVEAWAARREKGTPLPTDSIAAIDSARKVDGTATCGTLVTAGDGPIPQFRCPPKRRMWPYEIAPASEIADYYPPFGPGAAIPDRDGNLWILPRTTSQSRNGELVYDVVNPKQGFVQRVRLPVGRSIAGFGKGGVVYLQVGDMKSGFALERTAIIKLPPR